MNEIYGTDNADVLQGTAADDTIWGEGGADSIRGGQGADVLAGGSGDDTLEGGEDDDSVYGEGGDDVMHGGAGNDFLEPGSGADTVDAGAGDDLVYDWHGDGSDHIDGGAGEDSVFLGIDRDQVFVKRNADGSVEVISFEGETPDHDVYTNVEAFQYGDSWPMDADALVRGGPGSSAPTAMNDAVSVDEDGGAAIIDVLVNDTDKDAERWASDPYRDLLKVLVSVDGAGALGTVTQNADGTIGYVAPNMQSLRAGQTAEDSFTYTMEDSFGMRSTATVKVTIVGENDDPTAVGDAVTLNEDAATGNLWSTLLANDTDPDSGDSKTIVGVSTVGTKGAVSFDAATQQLSYTASGFDSLQPGQTGTDAFTYTMRDGSGALSTATVTMTINGIADDDGWISGTPGRDVLNGTNGADRIRALDDADVVFAGGGADLVLGGAGRDTLNGGTGDDTLDGGSGADVLVGGEGDDVFWFRPGEVNGDRVSDFGGKANKDDDVLVFDGFGPGAYLTRHGNEWTVHYGDDQAETFWMNDPKLTVDDFMFI